MVMFRDAMNELVDLYGETFPHVSVKHKATKMTLPFIRLPNGLFTDRKKVLEEMVNTGKLPSTVSKAWFYEMWDRLFPNVFIKNWNPFAKCDVCVMFRSRLLATRNLAVISMLKQQQTAHREYVASGRKRLKRREKISEDYPQDVLFVIFDAMDSDKVCVPRFRSDIAFCKQLEAEGLPLGSRVIGFLMPGRGFICYWTLPRFPQAGNLTCTLLLDLLQKVSIQNMPSINL